VAKAVLVLANDEIRTKAKRWIDSIPKDSRVTFQPPRRTNPQNALWFAMLTEISQQKRHHGLKLSPEQWRLLFLDAWKREVCIVPSLEGDGVVSLGGSSKLSTEEFSELIEVTAAWAARNGVAFSQ